MKVSERRANFLRGFSLVVSVVLSSQAIASIPENIQEKIEKDVALGNYREFHNMMVTSNGVTSRLLGSDVDLKKMVEMILAGNKAVLNHESLSYQPQLAF